MLHLVDFSTLQGKLGHLFLVFLDLNHGIIKTKNDHTKSNIMNQSSMSDPGKKYNPRKNKLKVDTEAQQVAYNEQQKLYMNIMRQNLRDTRE